MKKSGIFLITALVMSLMTVSCSKDNGGNGGIVEVSGVYILNSGNMGDNDAELAVYNPAEKVVTTNVFEPANGKKMGDTANDMFMYNNTIFIAMTGSKLVYVTDLKGKIVKELVIENPEGKAMSPRHITAFQNKVYVSLQEGYVAEITMPTYEYRIEKVGEFPEGLAYANGKIYVANSDGFNSSNPGTTISVIDASIFKVVDELKCDYNPQTFHYAPDGNLYLITWGILMGAHKVPASLQKIDVRRDEIETIEGVIPTNMAMGPDGKAYILSSTYDDSWNQTIKFYTFNTTTDTLEGELALSEEVEKGYSIFVDPAGLIYIGASDYTNTGDMYVFSPDGLLVDKFDTGAINPISVRFNLSYRF